MHSQRSRAGEGAADQLLVPTMYFNLTTNFTAPFLATCVNKKLPKRALRIVFLALVPPEGVQAAGCRVYTPS